MTYDRYPAVDESYMFPPEVRAALALSPELRNTVIPMTQTQRNNLTGDDLWDGRLVYNTDTDKINVRDEIASTWRDLTTEPPGIIKMWAGGAIPPNHHLCDGSQLDRVGIYTPLFNQIGTQWNVGTVPGTKFCVPNFTGRMPIGKDTGQTEFDTVGKTGGAKTHTLTEAEIAVHDHAGTTGAETAPHTHPVETKDITPGSLGGGGGSLVREGYVGMGSGRNTGTESVGHGHPFETDTAGGGAPHSILNPYAVVPFIITT